MGERNLMAAEMEASALYAFAQVRQKTALCFAHVIDQKGRGDGDLERGEAAAVMTFQLIAIVADRLRSPLP
jgi:uridine phosphorylase